MILKETVLRVLTNPSEFMRDDVIECYQWINDTGNINLLDERQTLVFNTLVENGLVHTPVLHVIL